MPEENADGDAEAEEAAAEEVAAAEAAAAEAAAAEAAAAEAAAAAISTHVIHAQQEWLGACHTFYSMQDHCWHNHKA